MTSADILGEEAAKWNNPIFLADGQARPLHRLNLGKKSTKVKTFEVVDERLASDHRPIVADIELK